MNLMAAGVEDIFTTPSLGDIRLSVDPSGLLHIGPLEAPVAAGAD